jgi:hypothetical protein
VTPRGFRLLVDLVFAVTVGALATLAGILAALLAGVHGWAAVTVWAAVDVAVAATGGLLADRVLEPVWDAWDGR